LTDFRPDGLEEKAKVREQRVVAQDGVAGLKEVARANEAQYARSARQKQPVPIRQRGCARERGHGYGASQGIIARRQQVRD